MTTTSTSGKIREALAKQGITSGRKLAKRMESRGVIYFIRGNGGWSSARAELHFTKDGQERTVVYRPTGVTTEVRRECVDRAMDDGLTQLGVVSWSRAPFSNCWLPSDDISRVHEEFDTIG